MCNAGISGSVPGSGRSPGEGNGNPLQNSCLESPTDRGAWRATVHRVAKDCTRLKQLSMHTYSQNGAFWDSTIRRNLGLRLKFQVHPDLSSASEVARTAFASDFSLVKGEGRWHKLGVMVLQVFEMTFHLWPLEAKRISMYESRGLNAEQGESPQSCSTPVMPEASSALLGTLISSKIRN